MILCVVLILLFKCMLCRDIVDVSKEHQKKRGANCRYFICIHCRKVDFSNKLMFNHHRYKDGCDFAKYLDGMPTLLFSYADFLLEQGKMVEVIGKEVDCHPMDKKKAQIEDHQDGKNSGIEEVASNKDDDQWRKNFIGLPSSMRQKVYVVECDLNVPSKMVLRAPNLFFDASPPKVDKSHSKPKNLKT